MTDLIQPLTQFGAAGLMGVLWVWERTMSRQRDQQLNETHQRLMHERDQMRLVIDAVERNTRVIEQVDRTHRRLEQLLERITDAKRADAGSSVDVAA